MLKSFCLSLSGGLILSSASFAALSTSALVQLIFTLHCLIQIKSFFFIRQGLISNLVLVVVVVLFQRQSETLQLALSLPESRVEVVNVVANGILDEARLLQITFFRSAHLMELRNLFLLYTQRLLLHESLGILQ